MNIADSFSSEESAPWWVMCKDENCKSESSAWLVIHFRFIYPFVLSWNLYLGLEKLKKVANEILSRQARFANGFCSFFY